MFEATQQPASRHNFSSRSRCFCYVFAGPSGGYVIGSRPMGNVVVLKKREIATQAEVLDLIFVATITRHEHSSLGFKSIGEGKFICQAQIGH